jgi:phosphonate transport system permease protein
MPVPIHESMQQPLVSGTRPRHPDTRRSLSGARLLGYLVVLLVLVLLASRVCGANPATFVTGIGKGLSLLNLFFPPSWSDFPAMLQPIGVTIVMAFSATVLGTLLSVPCALAAASNISPRWLRITMRFLIGAERGLPEIVLLLFAVAAMGLGALPGLLALSIASVGMLAKLLADATEEIDTKVLESIAATGATHSQVIRYAVIPQILPSLLANALFRFEVNVRASVLLGAVGAGGIGYVLSTSISALEYQKAMMAILASLVLVIASERISDYFRARVLDGGQKI